MYWLVLISMFNFIIIIVIFRLFLSDFTAYRKARLARLLLQYHTISRFKKYVKQTKPKLKSFSYYETSRENWVLVDDIGQIEPMKRRILPTL